ncbi:hypothetical protein BDC45DRAFT_104764 [Circinella umbellata]|nr:hypothetical protein BDC45DRAFT_104764 [Circinella umbellata]
MMLSDTAVISINYIVARTHLLVQNVWAAPSFYHEYLHIFLIKVMRHLTHLPSMSERTKILQAKYLCVRSQYPPKDPLFCQLQSNFNYQPSTNTWHKLQ